MSRILLPALLGAMNVATPAFAAQFNGAFNPSVTMSSVCTVASGSLGFGSVASLASAIDAMGTFSVTCSPSAHYNIGLGTGQNASSVTARRMKIASGPSLFVNYALYSDSNRTQNWGETSGVDTVSDNGNGNPRVYSVYGRIPTQTSPGNSLYNDTVQIVVTY